LELIAHRIVSGAPVIEVLAGELSALNMRRYMLVSTTNLSSHFDAITDDATRNACAARFTGVIPHVPEPSVMQAIDTARDSSADGLLVFGGGSAMDTAKAVSHRTGLPILAVPTNFSGSEVTWNFGLTVKGVKQTVRNPAVLPRTVIYDPVLLMTLPAGVAICSGINAIAHAIEALYAPQSNPLTHVLAETGIRKMIGGLRRFCENGERTTDAASDCLTGSWLCGEVLSQVGMGFHHRICHVLGGTFGLPHAEVHTVLLPYSVAWNYGHVPALAALSDVFEQQPFARALAEFSVEYGAPCSLEALGLSAAQIHEAAVLATSTPIANPRPVSTSDIEAILAHAFAGDILI
jgi:maleylacetate reductase